MTRWRVTRTWLVEAETGPDAIEATAGTAAQDVSAAVAGKPTGYAAGLFAKVLKEREAYWRETIGDEAWQKAQNYWRERITADARPEED